MKIRHIYSDTGTLTVMVTEKEIMELPMNEN